jgi:hypothetical protein
MENEVAILITAFNRPKNLKSLLQNLSTSEYPIFVSIDAARDGDVNNSKLVDECLDIANELFKTNGKIRIEDVNQGCFLGVSRAISWGFQHSAKLIILEDDIVPSKSFLDFAEFMLSKYEDDPRVGCIGGSNLVPIENVSDPSVDYRFSAYTTSWGWATWADRWADYEEDLSTFPIFEYLTPKSFWSFSRRIYWSEIFKATSEGLVDTWDYRWLYSNWKRNRLTVLPNSNLVLNIGFGEMATHTKDQPWWLPDNIDNSYKVRSLASKVARDKTADDWMECNHFRSTVIFQTRRQLSKRLPWLASCYRKVLGTKLTK